MKDTNLVKKRRNAKSHQAILKATMHLLGSNGYVDFSIEKVAEMAPAMVLRTLQHLINFVFEASADCYIHPRIFVYSLRAIDH